MSDHEAVRIDVGLVTGNYFSRDGPLADPRPQLRLAATTARGAAPVMMLTHEYWQKRFGGDPSIVGKTLRIGGKAVTVVGVLQPAPYFPATHRRADEHGEQRASPERDDGHRAHASHDGDDRAARAGRHGAAGARRSRRRSPTRAHKQFPEAYDAALGLSRDADAVSGSARPEGAG